MDLAARRPGEIDGRRTKAKVDTAEGRSRQARPHDWAILGRARKASSFHCGEPVSGLRVVSYSSGRRRSIQVPPPSMQLDGSRGGLFGAAGIHGLGRVDIRVGGRGLEGEPVGAKLIPACAQRLSGPVRLMKRNDRATCPVHSYAA